MSGRRRQTLSPSLFPFLAVLVCTLGTLILLLALVAQNATEAAEQSARAKKAAAEKDALAKQSPRLAATAVNDLIGEEKLRIEHLVAVRDQQTADVEERRDRLTHLEDHIDRLRQQLQQLRIEVERATGDAPTNVIDVSAIEELKEEIAPSGVGPFGTACRVRERLAPRRDRAP